MANRITTAVLITALLVAGISMIPIMTTAQETPTSSESQNATAPGQLLTGVLGVQGAELDGEVERRTFGIKVALAASNDSRADIVKENLEDQESRLSELQEQKEALDQARENGSLSNGSYNAQIAILAAQTANVENQLNATENATEGLPVELLQSKGINVEAIQMLKTNASNMTGPEVAAIARTIAGPEVGKSITNERAPIPIGPPSDAGPYYNGTLSGNNTSENNPDGQTQPRGPPEDTGSGDNQSNQDQARSDN